MSERGKTAVTRGNRSVSTSPSPPPVPKKEPDQLGAAGTWRPSSYFPQVGKETFPANDLRNQVPRGFLKTIVFGYNLVFSTIVSYTRRPRVRKENTICLKSPFSFLRPPAFYITGSFRAETRKSAARSSLGFCACIMSPHLSINTRKDNSTKESWETVRASVCVPEILGTRIKSPSSPSCLLE